MATVTVNDMPVDIGTERLNLVQAAQKAGVFVPHYCWHPALTVVASCRMCLVEIGERRPDGSVVMQKTMTGENKVVPACQTPARDNTVIVIAAQAEKIGAGEGVVAHATRRIRAGANSPGGEPGPLPG